MLAAVSHKRLGAVAQRVVVAHAPDPAGSSPRARRPFIVEVQQRVDVGDQRRGLPRANAEQHLAARHQQLVAKLQRLREIRLGAAYAHPATVQAARERSPAGGAGSRGHRPAGRR